MEKWMCKCGTENIGKFCITCGQGKPKNEKKKANNFSNGVGDYKSDIIAPRNAQKNTENNSVKTPQENPKANTNAKIDEFDGVTEDDFVTEDDELFAPDTDDFDVTGESKKTNYINLDDDNDEEFVQSVQGVVPQKKQGEERNPIKQTNYSAEETHQRVEEAMAPVSNPVQNDTAQISEYAYGEFSFDWECPNCGATNSKNFCTECGNVRPAPTNWMCPNCGDPENSGKFCGNCGGTKPEFTPTIIDYR